MMISELDSENGDRGDGNSNNGQLLRDIEAISKALYLHKTPQTTLVSSASQARSKSVERPRLSEPKLNLNPVGYNENVLYKDKKSSSVWNWKKPLKVLTHIRRQKFNICFFLHVHSIEGLPPSFNDFNLLVHWKRKDEILQTGPSKVLNGVAEFDETLMHKSSVYGSRSGSNHAAKYEEKLFLIYTTVIGATGVDMGKQWVDLTRLLPLNLEELDREKSFGKWTTSFKLSGKARGATLNISFGYSILGDGLTEPRSNMNVSELVDLASYGSCSMEKRAGLDLTGNNATLRRVGSVPSDLNHRSSLGSQTADIEICDDVSSNLGLELSKSINFLYQKLNEVKLHSSQELGTAYENAEPLKTKLGLEFDSETSGSGNENDSIDFTVIDKGIEIIKSKQLELDHRVVPIMGSSAIETIDVNEIVMDDDVTFDEKKTLNSKENTSETYVDKVLVDDYIHEENSVDKKSVTVDNMESAFHRFLASESTKFELPWDISEILQQENFMETKSDCKSNKLGKKSHSFDDVTESIACDFLNMLEIEHSPFGQCSESDLESPRERLLRDFEKEFLDSGEFFADYDAGEHEESHLTGPSRSGCKELSVDLDISLAVEVQEEQQQPTSLLSRRKAEVLEDLETEALMREWGLNEKAFQSSPRYCPDGFGSPVEILAEDPVELPPLGDGFGPFVQTKGGGCLRSMSPSLFRGSKSIGHLIMQVSHPVVLPAELGLDIMEILQHLALVGIDQLSLQLNELMPLEDITWKTLQQIACDAAASESMESNRHGPFGDESLLGTDTIVGRKKAGEYSSSWFFSNTKSSTFSTEMDMGYVSPEYLASLMLNKIEGISIEGLRIQSGLSEEQAPSSFSPQNIENILAFEGKSAYLRELFSLEGGTAMQPYGNTDDVRYVTKLLSLSLTLEEWLRCDAGFIDDEDHLSNHSIVTLAAHHAKCINAVNGTVARDVNLDNSSYKKEGLLGNNITIALRVLHRDPFRNYEAVGAPMLALIQVERARFCPKPMLYSTVVGCNQQEGNGNEETTDDAGKEEIKEESSVWFRISEVHLSGLNTEPGRIPNWCTKTQQQSGTRWLVANGMSKSYKNPFPRSKAIVVSYPQMTKMVKNRDTLWSLSSRCNDAEIEWNELAGLTSHTRNPDVIFPNESL